ncbi:MAG: hypothetical protein SOW21_09290 [[Actinobacillus] rossii]|uniref:Uncharacterized protein n=1 Tax=[Actinobacillus] rossii TaxID=123820 RepID=A0A380TYS3_9PAST|nr:hypothetical protein [[Actinobacillus] rossii]SUT93596.1 Uncharacterised protein [[Actinobacillus] rossii]
MYFIENDIAMHYGIADIEKRSFHFVSRITIDYVNTTCEVELTSYTSFNDFLELNNGRVSFFTIEDCPQFEVDPSFFVLSVLITNEKSIFYGMKIKHMIDIKTISQVKNKMQDDV